MYLCMFLCFYVLQRYVGMYLCMIYVLRGMQVGIYICFYALRGMQLGIMYDLCIKRYVASYVFMYVLKY